MANQITLCDVSPRDGIQNEKSFLSAAQSMN
jgi:isopropylmalate/homocitrate/citramalate synthase